MATTTLKKITPADIGAVAKTGDAMTGTFRTSADIIMTTGMLKGSDETNTNHAIRPGHDNFNHMQFFEYGGVFTFYKSINGTDTPIFQIKDGASSAPLRVENGGTGANSEAGARANLGITPANIGAVSISDVINIAHGGTGATKAAVTITDNYSSVLNAINAVKGTRIFPISIQKNTTSSYSDMPSGYETYEWNLLLFGDATRMTALLHIYTTSSLYIRNFYSGNWLTSWVQLH